jgi:hypothetical protein
MEKHDVLSRFSQLIEQAEAEAAKFEEQAKIRRRDAQRLRVARYELRPRGRKPKAPR